MSQAEELVMQLETGPVTIRLRPDLAPSHVRRVVELAQEGFYDGLAFHRVIPGFMAQGGDPRGDGLGGSAKDDLAAEFSTQPHARGVCAMARGLDPDSANCQFYICFAAAPFLDSQYSIWGEVIDGMENVERLPAGEPPERPGRILSMRPELAAPWIERRDP